MVRLLQGQEATWVPGDDYPLGYDETQTLAARLNLIAPFKPRVDVVVVGKAYPSPGMESDRLVARVRIGDFAKAISITGDRLWLRDGGRWGSSPARPFSQMLLSPERAIRSAENPVGFDPAAIPIEGRLSLPNLEPVAGSFSAIIGPVPPIAPSRRNLLSPSAAAWVTAFETGRPPGPVPHDMNFAFFNVAPVDQQLAEIGPGSAIVLENLHPMHSVFTSRLPMIVPRVEGIDPMSGRPLDPMLRCDTVWIDPEREIAWLTFRGTADLLRPDLPVSLSVSADRAQRAPEPAPHLSTQTMLTTQQGGPVAQGLPFPAQAPKGPAFGSYSAPAESPAGYYGAPPQRTGTVQPPAEASGYPRTDRGSYPPPPMAPRRSITAEILVPAQAGGLPFGQSAEGVDWESTADLETTSPGLVRLDTAEIHDADIHADETPTPPPPPRTAPPPPPSAFAGLPFSQQTNAAPLGSDAREPPTVPRRNRLQPKGSPGPIPDIGMTLQPDLSGLEDVPPTTLAPPAIVPTNGASAITNGTIPLAPPKVIALPALRPPPSKEPAPAPPVEVPPVPALDDATADAEVAASMLEPAPKRERDALELEECARVRAMLSVKGADKERALATHDVTESAWARIEREHLKRIDEAAQAGDVSLLERYDDAFIGAQDELRGRSIDGPAYARIQIGRERNQLASVLDELGVGRNDLLRLDRVWRRRLASNKALAEEVEDEMERLRDGAF